MTITIGDLPFEILESIILLILPSPPCKSTWKDRSENLRNFSLVSSQWRIIAQTELTRHVMFFSPMQLGEFMMSIRNYGVEGQRLNLNLNVQSIEVKISRINIGNIDQLIALLKSFEGLKTVTIINYSNERILSIPLSMLNQEVEAAFFSGQLRCKLDVIENSIPPLQTFHNLRSLALREVILMDVDNLNPNVLPSLRNLQLNWGVDNESNSFNPTIFASQLHCLDLGLSTSTAVQVLSKMDISKFISLKVLSLNELDRLKEVFPSPLEGLEEFFNFLPSKLQCLHFPFTIMGFKPLLLNLTTSSSLSELHTLYYLDAKDSHLGIPEFTRLGMTDVPFTYFIAMEAGRFSDLLINEDRNGNKKGCRMISRNYTDGRDVSVQNSRFWKSVSDYEKGLFVSN